MTAIPTLILALALITIFYAQSGQMPAFALAIPAPVRRAGRRVANILGAISAAYGTPPSQAEIERDARDARERAAAKDAELRAKAAATTAREIEASIELAKAEKAAILTRASIEAAHAAEYDSVSKEWAPKIEAARAISAGAERAVRAEAEAAKQNLNAKWWKTSEDARRAEGRLDSQLAELTRLLGIRRRLDFETKAQAQAADAEAAVFLTAIDDKRATDAEIAAARAAGVTALAIVGSHADGDAQRNSDVDVVAIFTERTPAAVAAVTAVVRRWTRQNGVATAPIELHSVHRPFAVSKAPIALIEGPIPTEAPDLSDPGTALRAAAMAAHRRGHVERVAVEALSSARPDTLANALAYCARRGVQVASLTTFAGKPFAG